MPPRIPRAGSGGSWYSNRPIGPQKPHICPICLLSGGSQPQPQQRNLSKSRRILARRYSSLLNDPTTNPGFKPIPTNPRSHLRNALLDLQKDAGGFINISRLQLALRGLAQDAGEETIRIAILAVSDGGTSLKKAKYLLRLLLADPLKKEEEWERILASDSPGSRPLLVRVGYNDTDKAVHTSRIVQEVDVFSPVLNGHNLEILVLEMDPQRNDDENAFIETVLVPTMEIPTSSTGRYTPITTPVHKSLIVANGVMGAATVLNYSVKYDKDTISTAVDLLLPSGQEQQSLQFQAFDVALAGEALALFRKSVDNALVYEEDWFKSGLPEILEWLRSGSRSSPGITKQPLKRLIESLVANADSAIEAEHKRQVSTSRKAEVSSSDSSQLHSRLLHWAERAHTELRDELDVAFTGRRWRKLSWWKLFWRVDDVSMITTDILNQRFLVNAENESIFLAGQMSGASLPGVSDLANKPDPRTQHVRRLGWKAPGPIVRELMVSTIDQVPSNIKRQPWPLHISATRAYLSQETVPALQALAQKLVLQTLSTTSFATAFGGLVYISSVSNTMYEAGAVIAVGIVYGLQRMQGKWEMARSYWEGEVREEGRRAVKGVQSSFEKSLEIPEQPLRGKEERDKAAEAVQKVRNALADLK